MKIARDNPGDHKFTATNAHLSIDDTIMMNAISVEFSETQQKLPIYGYKSVVWDEILLGDYSVQGVFGINYTDAYSINQYLRGPFYDSDEHFLPPVSGEDSVTADRRRFTLTISYLSKDFIKTVSDYDPVKALETTPPTVSEDSLNLVSEASKVQNTYSEDSHHIILESVIITRVEQSIVADGSPLIEFYSFIARKITNTRWDTDTLNMAYKL